MNFLISFFQFIKRLGLEKVFTWEYILTIVISIFVLYMCVCLVIDHRLNEIVFLLVLTLYSLILRKE
ncbi:hypothetical protein DQG23_00115 [Paenibacillus contaminans]|uniref:Uncharacterized protein n=1 Tax=Paenibacillus contaminans TaxID=450362 RepID=A0A329MT15_9BACL|nr:hypothetical protein DQG23_00115 [Paenibacillus contaminans]